MGIIGKGLGVYLGIKLVNGKLKPKFGKVRYIGLAFFGLLVALGVFLLWIGLTNGDSLDDIYMPILMIAAGMYIILISPVMVKDVSVVIEEGGTVKVFHKDREVTVALVKDDKGNFNFAKPNDKHNCVWYTDGSKMSSFNKYRVVNYLVDALHTNGLLSDEVRTTLE